MLAAIAILSSAMPAWADDDKLFNGVEKLTPARLVELVLERHPDPASALSAWQASLTRQDQQASLEDPVLSYSIAPRTLDSTDSDTGQIISVSQRLPWPGKLHARGDIQKLEANADKYAIDSTKRDLVRASKFTYADWYFIHGAIHINTINQSLLQEFRESARIKYVSGRASKQDILQADVELVLLEHRAIMLDRQKQEILATLNTLLQRQPDLALPSPAEITVTHQTPDVAELRNIAIQNRTELLVIDERIKANQERIDLAKLETMPDFNVMAGYNSLWGNNDQRLTVGVGINIPLQKKRHANQNDARFALTELRYQRQGLSSKIIQEVQQAYDRYRESQHVIKLYREKLLPLSEENVATARSEYESGGGEFPSLITAEKNLMLARLNELQAIADFYRRLSYLEWAAGSTEGLHEQLVSETTP